MPVLLLMLMLIPNLPGGKGTDPAPQCSKCHNRHFGKCLDERVKEQEEQLAVTKQKLRKQQEFHRRRGESAAVQQAQALPRFEDVDSASDENESDEHYPIVSVWNPGFTNVKGFAGDAQRCPNVQLWIPTVSLDREPLLLKVPGPSILFTHP